jgi:hypothetical protein
VNVDGHVLAQTVSSEMSNANQYTTQASLYDGGSSHQDGAGYWSDAG